MQERLNRDLAVKTEQTLLTCVLIIGSRCPWSDLWVRVSVTVHFADLTDVTLADEDTNSILTDNANRVFQDNVAIQVTQSGCQLWNQAMQVESFQIF